MAAQSQLFAEGSAEFALARAPGPEAVNWAAIWTNAPARAARKYPAAIAFAAIIIFPIGFFTGALGISQP